MAKNNFNLTKDLLHEVFTYSDGKLFWKVNSGNRKNLINKEAGCFNKDGYVVICLKQKSYMAHKLIYAMFYGVTDVMIDHIDGNRCNNRIENLRQATYSQNLFNTKIYKNNKIGVKGISYVPKISKYVARCQTNGRSKYLGAFDSLNEAQEILKKYRLQSHGEYANHG